ncbi:T9SS type A sorting domain-containing protein [uncultured Pontibacter sp.]|uniref:T9SS type A sorting domain-containing protein n=1 Tax=uncultured Pontibacter sp. TaxID=453356 RepID=UPI0026286071|nr:T9SS type A sorting domain-containing protein [uncultured Pontibacter sp.]
MESKLYSLFYILLFFILTAFFPVIVHAQTPGFIYKPATGGGEKVLDPNGNGYISLTTAGFTGTNDMGAAVSEIPYRQVPTLENEVVGDLNTGSAGGHTDLVPPTPVQVYFDGINIMFRLRVGSSSTASKGYNVLLDTDGQFGNLIAGGSLENTPNPGFEYEIALESNFDVAVFDHRNNPNGGPKIWSRAVDQYSQRSVAATTNSGNADYFYDFYVPLSALPGVTAETPLRIAGVTITSAQSGITGTVSDVGGVNFQAYGYNKQRAWLAIMNGFPATSLNNIRTNGFALVTATAPAVNSPILANSTSISGTSGEAAGSVVTVYRNGVAICGGSGQPTCPTVSATGTWSLTGLAANLLVAHDRITAVVTPTGKNASAPSAAVTVLAGVCLSTPPPVITTLGGSGNSNRTFVGTTTFASSQRISIYTNAGNLVGSFLFTPTSTGTSTWTSPSYPVGETNYYATVTPVNSTNTTILGCESLRSNQICFRNGQPSTNTQQISITNVTYGGITLTSASGSSWSDVPAALTSISGSLTAAPANIVSGTSGAVLFFVNAVERARIPITSTATTWTLTLPTGLALKAGDVLNVRSEFTLSGGGQTNCPVPSSISNILRVSTSTTPPVINAGPLCGIVRSISGTSAEPAGTVIEIYQNGTPTGRTGTVSSSGAWSVDLSPLTGGGIAPGVPITARARASGKALSLASNTVTSAAIPTGTITVGGPITEGQTSISGTAPASSQVTLYIEGTPFSPVTANASGAWVVSGLSELEVFAGASVTATFKNASGCESARATAQIVQCRPPVVNYTLSATPGTICGGTTTNITLSSSQYGVSYRVLVNGVESGSSVLGTGSAITLQSGPITNTGTTNTTVGITVRARKVGGAACDATTPAAVQVTVQPQPLTSALSFTSSTLSTCANQAVTFTLNGTTSGYTYRLLNEATNQLTGTAAVTGNGGSINLTTSPVVSNTTYSLVVTAPNSCALTLPSRAAAIVTGASTTRAVFPTASKVCAGGSTLINVSTEPNEQYQYTVYRRATATNGLAVDQALGSFAGNGSILNISTGVLSVVNTETFYVTVRNLSGSCGLLTLSNQATVSVTNNATVANAGPDATVCGTTATLAANDVSPGIGTWSQVSGPSTVNFSSPNNANAAIQNLASGTYVLRWTVQTSCGGGNTTTQDDVVLRVNCDAAYTLAVPKYKDLYTIGEALATATDPDAAITTAQLTRGALPPGTTLNTANGTISVSNRTALTTGTYNLIIQLTDALGGVTSVGIVVRILGDSPTITPLPVELISFTALTEDGSVVLAWATASEENNAHFEVERSTDGTTFESIGTVKGMGNSNQKVEYNYRDINPLPGTAYYRLKQVDLNGDFEYSKLVAVYYDGPKARGKTYIYPNPFKSEINIRLHSAVATEATVQLLDLQGRVVQTETVQLQQGLNELVLPVKPLKNGVYFLRLSGNGISVNQKLVRSR